MLEPSNVDAITIYVEQYHPYCTLVLCVIGIVLNIGSILVLKDKSVHSLTVNRILMHLAIVDVLFLLEYLTFATIFYLITSRKPAYYWMAYYFLVHAHINQVLHAACSFLTVLLAVWRYLALRHPLKTSVLCSNRHCTVAIILCHLASVLFCLPAFFIMTIVEQKGTATFTPHFKSNHPLTQINFLVVSILLKLLPCIILTVISVWLIRTVYNARKRHFKLLSTATVGSRHSKSNRERKSALVLLTILVLFLATELPQGVFTVHVALQGERPLHQYYRNFGAIMDLLATINCAANILVYCQTNRLFRLTLNRTLWKRYSRTASVSSITTTVSVLGH